MTLSSSWTLAINWPGIITGVLLVLFLLASVFLILVVLVQKPQGGGLAGAFGSGAGSGQTAFGARTGDALTVATISFFVFYLASAVGLTYFMRPQAPSVPAAQVGAPAESPQGEAPPAAAEQTPTNAPATAPADAPASTPSPAPAAPAPGTEPKADPAPKG